MSLGVRIISRPEQLTIFDQRPAWPMLLSMLGTIVFVALFAIKFAFDKTVAVDSLGLWLIGIAALACIGLSFFGTIREQYIFDRPSDTYQFTRQFLYKRETIEGTISQFRGVGVKTDVYDDTSRHSVVLRQDGILLGASPEQQLRESKPVLNLWSTEARIAEAIHKFLDIPRVDSK